jgi:biotin-dependent carboxylase-like uncharacterized protein
VTVLATGPLATVQDEGRVGQAVIGIARSGACDRAAYRLANRLVGNHGGEAVLEVTGGGLALRAETGVTLVTTGAPCPGAPHNAPIGLRGGAEVRLGTPSSGLRTYVAVRGGFAVEPVLGARARDTMAELGPPTLRPGDRLPIGEAAGPHPHVDVAPVPDPAAGEVTVRLSPGPRRDWFPDEAWQILVGQPYQVSSQSNRIGIRLTGPELSRREDGELPSEGMVRGALQIPPSGTPVLFLADHPVTGGYPVIAYVHDDEVDRCAQLRPGQTLRFTDARRR